MSRHTAGGQWVCPHPLCASHHRQLQSERESNSSQGDWFRSQRVEMSPTISSWNLSTSRTSSGSVPNREVTFYVPRASFSSRGSDRQGLRLQHCTRPPWPLPRVVSPSEGGPTSCVRAMPDRAPWAQARPPGAHCRAPPLGLAPGGGPGDPRPGKG